MRFYNNILGIIMENKKIEFMKNFINDREKLMRILLCGSVALDIFLVLCFVIGFALGMGSSEIGFFMIGIIFRYGLILFIISIILKFVAFILSLRRDTKEKRKYFFITLFSLFRLLFIGALVYGIYYIGKIMTAVG